MVSVIGFDMGGVYLNNSWDEGIMRSIAEMLGLPAEPILKRSKELLHIVSVGRMTEDEFLRKIIPGLGAEIDLIKALIRSMNKVEFPDVAGIMENLRETYKIVMMNNEGREWNDFRMQKFHINKFFDQRFTSCDLGCRKPHKEYFQLVLERLSIAPNELLFIDNQINNIEGARSLGINAIHFRNAEQLKDELGSLGLLQE